MGWAWRRTLVLTAGIVTLVTVAMATCLWVHACWGSLGVVRVILALFTPCISMTTQWLKLLDDVGHVTIQQRRHLCIQQYPGLECRVHRIIIVCIWTSDMIQNALISRVSRFCREFGHGAWCLMSNKWKTIICLGQKQVLPSSQLGRDDIKVDLKKVCFTSRFHATISKLEWRVSHNRIVPKKISRFRVWQWRASSTSCANDILLPTVPKFSPGFVVSSQYCREKLHSMGGVIQWQEWELRGRIGAISSARLPDWRSRASPLDERGEKCWWSTYVQFVVIVKYTLAALFWSIL